MVDLPQRLGRRTRSTLPCMQLSTIFSISFVLSTRKWPKSFCNSGKKEEHIDTRWPPLKSGLFTFGTRMSMPEGPSKNNPLTPSSRRRIYIWLHVTSSRFLGRAIVNCIHRAFCRTCSDRREKASAGHKSDDGGKRGRRYGQSGTQGRQTLLTGIRHLDDYV